MRGYFLRKVVYLLVTLLLILTFNFILFRIMPGDPIYLLFPKGAEKPVLDLWRETLGLDQPIYIQYFHYLIDTFQGDLGISFSFAKREQISDILPPYIQKTLFLSGTGVVIAIFIGIAFGREAAWRKGKMFDKFSTTAMISLYSIPTFLYALFFIMIFARFVPNWPFVHATGDNFDDLSLLGKAADISQHAFLPILSLVMETMAGFALIVRSSLIDVMTEDYMLTAEAKGLPERDVLRKHAMPNALLPVVAVIAFNVGWILGGTVMIEYIFTYKGLGFLTWEAVLGYDFPLLQACFFIETVAVLISSFIADILNFYLDPRVKI